MRQQRESENKRGRNGGRVRRERERGARRQMGGDSTGLFSITGL